MNLDGSAGLRLAPQPFTHRFGAGVVHVMEVLADNPDLTALRQLLERVEQYGDVLAGGGAAELDMDFLVYLGMPDRKLSAKIGDDFYDGERQAERDTDQQVLQAQIPTGTNP
jgi:hypothetical protein